MANDTLVRRLPSSKFASRARHSVRAVRLQQRRALGGFSFLAGLAFLFATAAHAQSFSNLERGFQQPPNTVRPRTLWMWMNGNVTADGITRDLEAMRNAG